MNVLFCRKIVMTAADYSGSGLQRKKHYRGRGRALGITEVEHHQR